MNQHDQHDYSQDKRGVARRTALAGTAAAVVLVLVGLVVVQAVSRPGQAGSTVSAKQLDARGGERLNGSNQTTSPAIDAPDTPQTPQAPDGLPELPEIPDIPAPTSGQSSTRSSGSYSSGWSSSVNGESHGGNQHWTYQQPGDGWQRQRHESW